MRRILVAAVAGVALSIFQSGVSAADAKRAMDEAKEHGCLACHDVDKKKVGPAYKEIAAKSKGKKVEDEMAAMKSKKVHASVLKKTSDSSLKEIMEWILSL